MPNQISVINQLTNLVIIMRNFLFTILLTSIGFSDAIAVDLKVVVTDVESFKGRIGCGLYDSSGNFPMGTDALAQVWIDAKRDSVRCIFSDLSSRRCAVAISHDAYGTQIADTSFLGIPKEARGVSNNTRPLLRASMFKQAEFFVGSAPVEIQVELYK